MIIYQTNACRSALVRFNSAPGSSLPAKYDIKPIAVGMILRTPALADGPSGHLALHRGSVPATS